MNNNNDKKALPKGSVTLQDLQNEADNLELKLNSIDELNKFPIEIFPKEVQFFINELANKKAIPIEFISGSLLSAFSTSAGKKFRLKHNNYDNFCGLWVGIVGESGTNKSEPLKIAFKPLKDYDSELYEKYKIELQQFEIYEALTAKEKRQTDKVYYPKYKTHVVDDYTIETLYEVFEENKNGICCNTDELMTWILDLERYGYKSNQTKYLSIWSNADFTYIRKKEKRRINKPFFNVIGGIQTDLLLDLAKENRAKDGTIHRILFCYPDRVEQGKPNGTINESLFIDYDKYIKNLLLYKSDTFEDGNVKSKTFYIDSDATGVFNNYDNELREKLNSLPESAERKFIAKLQIYLHRLTLLLHLIECSINNDFSLTYIQKDTVLKAIRLIKYFHLTANKVGEKIEKKNHVSKNITIKDLAIELKKRTSKTYKEIIEFLEAEINENTFRSWINRN